ncbi:type VII secretion integral membrane protein EccD [Aldersonia sp. NBC_00410]|uniref:type VII secretion integral membrane protein EccD n=1 Tax=Aldersonia sp. NBC_00410 TaxID=2975954 RepID=UPI00224DE570|nr:type VII secretion integral membrane protein EccD [Aldersonia sp. NBC_00410]MCX5046297.1 type VII secretion integral membrane protein EccD [Aldersonia sp. NBC_00410]
MSAPSRVRVAILVGHKQIDVDLADQVALEIVMEDLLTTLAEADAEIVIDRSRPLSLARIGQSPVPRHRTLAHSGVLDGSLLELRPAGDGEHFRPLVEEISAAVAQINERDFPEFEPSTARAASLVAVVAGAVTCAGLLIRSWQSSTAVPGLVCAGVALLLGVVAAGTAGAARAWWHSTRAGYAGSIAALVLLGTGGGLLVPAPEDAAGHFTAANVVAAAAVAGLTSALLLRALGGLGVMLHATVITAAVAAGIDGLFVGFVGSSVKAVAAATVIVAVIVLVNAPKVTVIATRIRPPNLPAPGEDLDPEALEGAFGVDDVDPTSVLERRARAANKALTGLLVGTTTVLVVATVVTVAPHTYHLPVELVVAALVVGTLFLRARSYTDRVQALVMYGAAFATVAGAGARIVNGYSEIGPQLVAVAVMAAVTVAAAAAARLPGAKLSPVTRRSIELTEQLLVVVLIPLAAWVMGVYSVIRNI